MPVNWSNPSSVEKYRQFAIQQGVDPSEVEQLIKQNVKTLTAPTAPLQEPKSIGGFIGNVAKSGMDALGGIANIVLHPIETVKNVGKVGIGAVQLAIPGEQGLEDNARAVGKFYGDRYGSLEKIGNTLYNDPVGTALDASALLGAGGAVVGKVGKLGKIESVINAGTKLDELAAATDPIRAVSKVAGKVINPKVAEIGNVTEDLGTKVRQGVSKIYEPSSVHGAADEARIAKTLDDLKITGSAQAKYEKLQPAMKVVEDTIQKKLVSDPKMVSVDKVKTAVMDKLKEPLLQNKLTKPQATQALDDVMQKIMVDAGLQSADEASLRSMGVVLPEGMVSKGAEISTKDVFALKQKLNGMYAKIQKAINSNVPLTPEQEVIYASRGALDSIITELHPDIKKLTLIQSDLYDAADSLGRARKTVPTSRIGGTTVPSQIVQPIQDVVGGGLQKMGNRLKNIQLGELPTSSSKFGPPGILAKDINQTSQEVQPTQQDTTNNVYANEGENVDQSAPSMGSIVTQLSDSYTEDEKTKAETLNEFGVSPQQIYQAYTRASVGGNKRKAAVLRQMYLDEVDYQEKLAKKNGPAKKSVSEANALTDIETGQSTLNILEDSIHARARSMGPIMGRISGSNPYDTEAQAFQAQVKTAAQVVGKALEGGVLRKEDEVKYAKILPQITDTKEVALLKLKNVQILLNQKKMNTQANFGNAVDPYGLGATPPVLAE